MVSLQEALKASRHVRNRTGRGPKPQIDWDNVIRLWFRTENQHEVSALTGIRQGRVSRILKNVGIHVGRGKRKPVHILPMDQVEAEYAAGKNCRELGEKHGVDGEVIRRRMSAPRRARGQYERRGKDNPQWKGGHSRPMHYYRRQSYEVTAICLGSPLPQGWVIHHIDENSENNDPSNLMVFPSQGHHAKFHQRILKLRVKVGTKASIRLALEIGGFLLPKPPSPISFALGKDQPSLEETLRSKGLHQIT